MNDTIKLYLPKNQSLVESHTEMGPVILPRSKRTKAEILQDTITEIEDRTRELEKKHPWAQIFYRWFACLMCIVLAVSLVVWGIQIGISRKIEISTATALADYDAKAQAEKQAAEEQAAAEALVIANSQETIMKNNATAKAKLLYGIRNFEEKYGYTKDDLFTYLECVENRVKHGGYGNTVEEVINQKDQWVGYSPSNQVTQKYYDIAMEHEKMKQTREADPISTDYVFALLTERGIFLSDEFDSKFMYTWWRMNG